MFWIPVFSKEIDALMVDLAVSDVLLFGLAQKNFHDNLKLQRAWVSHNPFSSRVPVYCEVTKQSITDWLRGMHCQSSLHVKI